MPKYLFASDLDNTLLFSYKYAQDTDLCVELLHDKRQGYMTALTVERLRTIHGAMCFVPVTSRSIEQYQRIQFPTGCIPQYALTTNGAILLVDGKIDEAWQQRSLRQVAPWREEIMRIYDALQQLDGLTSCRVVDEMYLFAACQRSEEAAALQAAYAAKTSLHVAATGRKVYFFPPPFNKGSALQALQAMLKPEMTICAGDSSIDIPMLKLADLAIAPEALGLQGEQVHACPPELRFPDFVTETVLKQL